MEDKRMVPGGREGGFTIVEIVVAIMILTFGVLGLAGTTALMVRQVTLAQMATERAAALQSVLEQLRSTDWESVADGSTTVGHVDVTWWIDGDFTQSRVMKVVTVGPGVSTASGIPVLRPDVADTFTYRLLRY
jgi:Tfp pilus assembly protein PilV